VPWPFAPCFVDTRTHHPHTCHRAATLTELERSTLADSLDAVTYSDGEVILRQNDPGRHMYIVEAVRCLVFVLFG